MKHKELPSIEILNERLIYDASEGKLINKITRCKAKAGEEAGSYDGKGYKQVVIMRSKYLVHRIIWKMHTGTDPGNLIVDHKDRNPDNNHISNLRLLTKSENQENTIGRGIVKLTDKRKKAWQAAIRVNGVQQRTQHECPLMARLWYLDKKAELHPCFTQSA